MGDIKEDARKSAMRAFFAACNEHKLSEDARHAIVEGFGHESTAEMTTEELIQATQSLCCRDEERNKWVKRCMAVIYEYCERKGYKNVGSDYVKSIITTSAMVCNFNKLTTNDLKRVYNCFKKKENDKEKCDKSVV